MIINSEGGVKQTIGQTTEYKTTIDIENIDFITTLLSSNLYSNPEDSFIREIVSNGWDAHVEAGTTDVPLVVRVKKNAFRDYDITIRDYGTGLSKEDFEKIYCKIGTSTKRNSNSFLGAFGIGKFSTMAVSKAAHITSYYNGIARLYIMTKDGNNITTNLVAENPTVEKNGLEVTVKNIYNIDAYEKALIKLAFFPNVYVDGLSDIANTIKVKRFKHFTYSTFKFTDKILLGNVLYPLDSSIIPSELIGFYDSIKNSGIVFNFNIGELNVTPNRESIIYNSKVNALIVKRIQEAKEEMEAIMAPSVEKDYTDPHQYYLLNCDAFSFDFIETKVIPHWSYTYNPHFRTSDLNLNITFYNKKVDYRLLRKIYTCRVANIKAVSDGERMWKSHFPWQASRIIENTTVPILLMPTTEKISKYIKDYLLEKYNNLIISTGFSYTDLERAYIDNYKGYSGSALTNNEKFVLDSVWKSITKRFVHINFDTDKNFLAFKEAAKKEAKDKKVTLNETIILTVFKPNMAYSSKRTFNSYAQVLGYIKGLNTGVLVRNLDNMQISYIASKLGYTTIAANKKVVDLLNKENLKCFISEEDIYSNKDLVWFNTIRKVGSLVVRNFSQRSFFATLPADFQTTIQKCNIILDKLDYYSVNYIPESSIPTDEDLYNKLMTIKNCYISYHALLDEYKLDSPVAVRDFISYIIMKNKLYKISYDCYKNIKNNKLLKAICQK